MQYVCQIANLEKGAENQQVEKWLRCAQAFHVSIDETRGTRNET
jgi:hypothetical protein